MAVVSKADAAAVFDLKSAALTLVAVLPKTADLALLADELQRRFGDTPLFDDDPVAIDFSQLRDESVDVGALIALLRRYRMRPIAAKGGSEALMQSAQAAGLAEAADSVRAEVQPKPPTLTEALLPAPATLVVDKPLRSGQQVYARGGDLVVLAVVSFGAEVIADGSIHVYAPLRGRAVAGARGDTEARIYTTCLEAQLVSIAGTYRTTETPLPDEVLAKPAQVRLAGDRLVIEPLKF
jgi:septum site-determining protein MinC